MLITITSIAVLLILSAFFSGSETALTAASRPLMHQMDQNGDARARIVNRLHEDKERLIGAILLGNNLVNILASALATSLLISMFGEAGVAYATLTMTLLVLIFAEILPKTYAFRNANRMALVVSPVVNAVVVVLSPIVQALQVVVSGTLRLFGVREQDDAEPTAEELRGAIELHAAEGRPVEHERAMLRSVLDLTEVQVGEIMIHRKNVTMIDASLPANNVVAEILDSPFTRIPLWRDEPDNIVGVVHAKALLRAVRARGRSHDVEVIQVAAAGASTSPWSSTSTAA